MPKPLLLHWPVGLYGRFCMPTDIFELLDARLQGLADIADHANIHFAYAASAEIAELVG